MNKISYLFFLNVLIFVFATPTFADTAAPAKPNSPITFESLPNTDGMGLLSKPPLFAKEQLDRFFEEGKEACAADCVTEFGTALGIADGIKGFSNCRSMCINPEYSFLDLDTKALSVHTEDPKKDNLHYVGLV